MKQDWKKDFYDFFFEQGRHRGRPLGYPQYEKYIQSLLDQQKEEMKHDISSVLCMLEGTTEREKIANYIREYLINS